MTTAPRFTYRLAQEIAPGQQRITNIGHDPWLEKNLTGTVKLKRPDAASLHVIALDFNGYPRNPTGSAEGIELDVRTMYYLITK